MSGQAPSDDRPAASVRGLPTDLAGARARRRDLSAEPQIALDEQQIPPLLAVVGLDAARVPGLVALLHEVASLRSSLRADLSLAETAARAGEPGLAAFLLAGHHSAPQARVATFEQRALSHLSELEQQESIGAVKASSVASPTTPRRRSGRMLPAAPLVAAAAALFGFLVGMGPGTLANSPENLSAIATADFAKVSQLAGSDAPAAEVSAAAAALHARLLPLVAGAASDPAAAAQALSLLQAETALRQGSSDPGQLTSVIQEAQLLVRRLIAALPSRRSIRPLAEPPAALPTPQPNPSASATAAAASSPPSRSPQPAATSGQKSPSPQSPRPSNSASPDSLPDPTSVGH